MNVGMADYNRLLAKNMRLTDKILKDLPYSAYKKPLFQWLSIEKSALSIFRELVNKSSKSNLKYSKIYP